MAVVVYENPNGTMIPDAIGIDGAMEVGFAGSIDVLNEVDSINYSADETAHHFCSELGAFLFGYEVDESMDEVNYWRGSAGWQQFTPDIDPVQFLTSISCDFPETTSTTTLSLYEQKHIEQLENANASGIVIVWLVVFMVVVTTLFAFVRNRQK